jgi:hypothetical protein
MLALVTTLRAVRHAGRLVTLSLMLAQIAGCRSKDTSAAGKLANAQTWAPDKLTSVQDVPATEIETLIQKKLDGPRLPKIDDDQWGHTRRLYKLYGNNPLWLTAMGCTRYAPRQSRTRSSPPTPTECDSMIIRLVHLRIASA